MNVRRPPRIVMIEPRICARFDCDKSIRAIFIGEHAACAGKIGVERRRMLVTLVVVTPAGIGLPDLDQSVWHRASIVVQYPARHNNSLTERFARMLARYIVL